jgi:hypothetical protein
VRDRAVSGVRHHALMVVAAATVLGCGGIAGAGVWDWDRTVGVGVRGWDRATGVGNARLGLTGRGHGRCCR